MRDLHEEVVALFEEAQDPEATDWQSLETGSLSTDSWTARSFAHEANYIAEARLAEGVKRWRCANCGEEVELRPGTQVPVHMGPFDALRESACPRGFPAVLSEEEKQQRLEQQRQKRREYLRRHRRQLRERRARD